MPAEVRLQSALGLRQPAVAEESAVPRALEPPTPDVDPAQPDAAPAALRTAMFDLRARGTWAIAVLAVLAAAVAGVVVLRARPRVTPVAAPVLQKAPVTAKPSAAPQLVVDVVGKVRRPGLQRLPPGSRVADAVAAAGGIRPGADTSGLNLARKLVDGEQIVVGAPAVKPPTPGDAAAEAAGPLNLNTATLADIEKLSGVGPVLAQRIVAWRDANGAFTAVEQLREVEGIGERKFASLSSQVTV